MTLAEIAAFVTTKVSMPDAMSVSACQTFINARAKQIYDAANWREALAMVAVSSDPTDFTQAFLPQSLEILEAVRLNNQSVSPFGNRTLQPMELGTIFNYDPNMWDQAGTATSFSQGLPQCIPAVPCGNIVCTTTALPSLFSTLSVVNEGTSQLGFAVTLYAVQTLTVNGSFTTPTITLYSDAALASELGVFTAPRITTSSINSNTSYNINVVAQYVIPEVEVHSFQLIGFRMSGVGVLSNESAASFTITITPTKSADSVLIANDTTHASTAVTSGQPSDLGAVITIYGLDPNGVPCEEVATLVPGTLQDPNGNGNELYIVQYVTAQQFSAITKISKGGATVNWMRVQYLNQAAGASPSYLSPSVISAPEFVNFKVTAPPTTSNTFLCLGKRRYVPMNEPTSQSPLRFADNAIIALATGDMWERMRQAATAQAKFQEAATMIEEMLSQEKDQSASNIRFIPTDIHGWDDHPYRFFC